MKSLLVHVSGGPGEAARIEAALKLARTFSGHLTFCQPAPPPLVAGGVAPGTLWSAVTFEDIALKSEEVRAEQRAKIEAKMANEDVPWDLQMVSGFAQEAFVAHSGLYDLAIVSLNEEDYPFAADGPFLSHVVTHAACPVLALPQDAGDFDPLGPALIAWDGSMEAASAVKAALGLLEKSSALTALSVGQIVGKPHLSELAQYLSRHNLSVTTDAVPQEGHISDTLVDAATRLAASYIVMGAYGHSRVLQTILGGETERMLRQSKVPVLFGR
ncbi:MAG: universal stress protein [Pseudomonadota bacterium]